MTGARTLVTGGAGFVGLNVVEQLLARGEHVVLADRNPLPAIAREDFARLPGRLETLIFDVTDPASIEHVFASARPTHLIHLAAITAGVERDSTDPASIARVNYLGVIDTLTAARKHGVKRIVYASTGALFGAAGPSATQPLDEVADRPAPNTIYGITKFAAERTCLRLKALWDLDLRVGRLAMVYGRWEYATGARDTMSPLWRLTRMAMAGATAVFPDAGPMDFVYGADIGRALIALLDAPTPRHPVYHLGVGDPWPLTAWCERLRTKWPQFVFVTSTEAREWTVPGVAPSTRMRFAVDRAQQDLGFKQAYPIDRAFDDYVEWIERHRGLLALT